MRTFGLYPALVLSSFTLLGCHEAINGHPDFPIAGMLPPSGQTIILAAATPNMPLPPNVPPNCIIAINYDDNPSASLAQADYNRIRNNCIETYLGAIDYQYDQYKRDIFHLSGGLNVTAETLSTIVSAGAAGVGGSAAQILSGISAGIGAVKAGIDDQILYKNTIATVVTQMDADRKEQLGVILQRMGQQGSNSDSDTQQTPATPAQPQITSAKVMRDVTIQLPATAAVKARTEKIQTTKTIITTPPAPAGHVVSGPPSNSDTKTTPPPYTMYAASVDLLGYFDAGTVTHALVSLQKAAGAKATNCQAQVNNLKTTGTKSGSPIDPDLTGAASPAPSSTTPSNPSAQPNVC
jgi:hypothetical protein